VIREKDDNYCDARVVIGFSDLFLALLAFARHKDRVDTPWDRSVCYTFLSNNDRQRVNELEIKHAGANESCPFSTV
jgi:hypothetical protein